MDKLDFGYYNMDCMAGMKLFPDKYFDVAIVDPPYGINAPNMAMGTNKSRTKNGYPSESTASRLKRSGQVKEWDSKPPTEEYFKELFRVSKNQIIWGGNYFNLPPTKCFVVLKFVRTNTLVFLAFHPVMSLNILNFGTISSLSSYRSQAK